MHVLEYRPDPYHVWLGNKSGARSGKVIFCLSICMKGLRNWEKKFYVYDILSFQPVVSFFLLVGVRYHHNNTFSKSIDIADPKYTSLLFLHFSAGSVGEGRNDVDNERHVEFIREAIRKQCRRAYRLFLSCLGRMP